MMSSETLRDEKATHEPADERSSCRTDQGRDSVDGHGHCDLGVVEQVAHRPTSNAEEGGTTKSRQEPEDHVHSWTKCQTTISSTIVRLTHQCVVKKQQEKTMRKIADKMFGI